MKIVTTAEGVYRAPVVILAMGADPVKLNVPGEAELRGRGVSYCATCDAPFFRDKKVVVVGGGDSALKEGLFISKFAREMVLVHRRQEFRAEKIYQSAVRSNPKFSLRLDSRPGAHQRQGPRRERVHPQRQERADRHGPVRRGFHLHRNRAEHAVPPQPFCARRRGTPGDRQRHDDRRRPAFSPSATCGKAPIARSRRRSAKARPPRWPPSTGWRSGKPGRAEPPAIRQTAISTTGERCKSNFLPRRTRRARRTNLKKLLSFHAQTDTCMLSFPRRRESRSFQRIRGFPPSRE